MKKFLLLLLLPVFVLTACHSTYKKDVDLTEEEITELRQVVKENKAILGSIDGKITKYEPVFRLARAYEKLGELGRAINVYEDVIESGAKNSALFNNLGRLYEKVEDYDSAIEMYQRNIDEFVQQKYLYDITWAYIRSGDRKNAEKYFNAWQLEFEKTDEQTQQAIAKLREAEGVN